jgi:hypothetical protein
MKALNSGFNFTVKLGQDHFAGRFEYKNKGVEIIRISCHKLPKNRNNGYAYNQVNYLRWMDGKWILWDVNRKAPKNVTQEDRTTYTVFREAYGLAQLHEA